MSLRTNPNAARNHAGQLGLETMDDRFWSLFSVEEFATSLQECTKQGESRGSALHLYTFLCQVGMDFHASLGNRFLSMYAKAGCMQNARKVFDKLVSKTDASWNSLIMGYIECEMPYEAFSLYEKLRSNASLCVSGYTYVALLKSCEKVNEFQRGFQIHMDLVCQELIKENIYICSSLVDMYAKLGMLNEAQKMFDDFPSRDNILWTALIAGYANNGFGNQAFHCFEQMRIEGIFPNEVTLLCILKASVTIGSVHKAQQLHCEIREEEDESGERGICLQTTLVYTYARCGDFTTAEWVFDSLPTHDVVSWTTLISGYVEYGHCEQAVACYERMKSRDIVPSIATFLCGLKACASIRIIEKGQEMHGDIEKKGLLEGDIALNNGLIDMYAKCGLLDTAKRVFDQMLTRNVVSWTALIGGHVEHGYPEKAVEYFELMQAEGISPNSVTFILMLKVCGDIGDRGKCEEIYSKIRTERLLEEDLILWNTLVDVFAKLGMLSKAHAIFSHIPVWNVVSWNALITGYAEHGLSDEALDIFQEMQTQGVLPDAFTFLSILRSCRSNQYIGIGIKIHVEIEKQGLLQENNFLESVLVDMYGKCGLLASAQCVFDNIKFKGIIEWTSMMSAYIENSCSEEALECLESMTFRRIPPTAVTLVCGLTACAQIKEESKGRELHAELERQGLVEIDHIVGNALIDMYAKCSSLTRAHEVFNRVIIRNVTHWNTLLLAYLEHGYPAQVLSLVEQLRAEGISPDALTFICTLKASVTTGNAGTGMDIHVTLEKRGMFAGDVRNSLVDMYAKCGYLDTAEQVFDKLEVKDVVSWNALITGYVEHGQLWRAMEYFEKMQDLGILPDSISIISILKACGSVRALGKVRDIHQNVENRGLSKTDMLLGSSLIVVYSDCGSFAESHQTFNTLPIRNVVSWNALMTGYSRNGLIAEALKSFYEMQLEGICPDPGTFLCLLKVCAKSGDKETGYEMDAYMKRLGICDEYFSVKTYLIYMYASCGLLMTAQDVFDKMPFQDISAWTAIVAGYTELGYNERALECYEQMKLQGISANPYITSSILRACGNIKAAGKGQEIHSNIIFKDLLETNVNVGTALVCMYMKCGLLVKAQEIFNKLNARNVVSWNTLISGYADLGNSKEAIEVYDHMYLDGVIPDATTFLCSLKACANYSKKGHSIHSEINRHRFLERNIFLSNKVIDIYARDGALIKAQEMFDMLQFRNVVSWNTLMASFSRLEHNEEAIECFEKMQIEGVSPNEVSFICTLKACGNMGAVEKGQEVHGEIERRGMCCHPIGNALVDMYAKCGSFSRAQQVFDKLRVRDVVSWTTLLAGYVRIRDDSNISLIFEKMVSAGIKPDDVTFTVILRACSQKRLIHKSSTYMATMYADHGIRATLKHHACIIDMLGRAGHLDLALAVIDKMPMPPDLVVWHSILEACKQLGNAELGRLVFEQTLNFLRENP